MINLHIQNVRLSGRTQPYDPNKLQLAHQVTCDASLYQDQWPG